MAGGWQGQLAPRGAQYRGQATARSHLTVCVYRTRAIFTRFIPADLPQIFTVPDLSKHIRQPSHLAGKMAYCLREMGVIEVVGKQGRALAYRVKPVDMDAPQCLTPFDLGTAGHLGVTTQGGGLSNDV